MLQLAAAAVFGCGRWRVRGRRARQLPRLAAGLRPRTRRRSERPGRCAGAGCLRACVERAPPWARGRHGGCRKLALCKLAHKLTVHVLLPCVCSRCGDVAATELAVPPSGAPRVLLLGPRRRSRSRCAVGCVRSVTARHTRVLLSSSFARAAGGGGDGMSSLPRCRKHRKRQAKMRGATSVGNAIRASRSIHSARCA